MGALNRLGGRGGSVAKMRHFPSMASALCCYDARRGTISRQEAQQRGFARRSGNHSHIARMSDSILRSCAPLRFHHMRFKLGLQNRAFLHFSPEGKMTVRIGACMNHDRVELQFSEIERLIPAQDSIPDASISVEERGMQPPSQCNGAQMKLFPKIFI
jgi:hypothetical protein